MINGSLHKLTCLIPLYRSERFLDIITDNIDVHLDSGATVLISDQHCLDAAADVLKAKYSSSDRVVIHKTNSHGDWVDNINFLIGEVTTQYARIMPHDDTASSNSSAILVTSLLANPDAIMASGIVKAIDLEGSSMPSKDKFNERENRENKSWSFTDAMQFFWGGRFAGAFKGVFDAQRIKERNVFIKKTPTLVHSERLWLSAIALIGRYQFEPDSVLIKRYHDSSTHAQWTVQPAVFLASAAVQWEYAQELIDDEDLLFKARFMIYHNAVIRARYLEAEVGSPPAFYQTVPQRERAQVFISLDK